MTTALRNETIIYFGPEPWDGLWRNRHQLMSRFAKNNNVWYVEPPAILRQLLRGKRHRTRLTSRDASGVNIFHSPWWLPIIGRPPLKRLTIRIYLAFLSRLAHLKENDPIVWLSRPGMMDFVGALNEKLTIYHIVDEYSGYGSASKSQRNKVQAKEAQLLAMVDMAIVVTPSLLELKLPHNPNTYLVPNAADFSAYADGGATVPGDMVDIPRPIIGYTGLIAARLDLPMLIAAADARPDWSFVFVGTVNDDQCESTMEALRKADNVYFTGQKDIDETPGYVNQFDVATIPYETNLRAQHASPLKLYEYAAASKPIVATDFAAARAFGGHIDIVRDVGEFVTACEKCLEIECTSPTIVENRNFAADNTWENRIEQVTDIIRSAMQHK